MRVLDHVGRSDIRFVGLTTMVDHKQNTDIATGTWRLINLQLPPFNLPPPLLYLDDDKNEVRDKRVAIWERGQLVAAQSQ